jgi:hypothetical protein
MGILQGNNGCLQSAWLGGMDSQLEISLVGIKYLLV